MIHKKRAYRPEDSWHLPVKMAKAMKIKLGHNFQHAYIPTIHYVEKDDDGNIVKEEDVPVTSIFGKELLESFMTGETPKK